MSIPQLMQLKLFLNKFLKIDNIEYYSMAVLGELRKTYEGFLETSNGTDPDFPMINFGEKGGEKYGKGNNRIFVGQREDDDYESSIPLPQQELINLTR